MKKYCWIPKGDTKKRDSVFQKGTLRLAIKTEINRNGLFKTLPSSSLVYVVEEGSEKYYSQDFTFYDF